MSLWLWIVPVHFAYMLQLSSIIDTHFICKYCHCCCLICNYNDIYLSYRMYDDDDLFYQYYWNRETRVGDWPSRCEDEYRHHSICGLKTVVARDEDECREAYPWHNVWSLWSLLQKNKLLIWINYSFKGWICAVFGVYFESKAFKHRHNRARTMHHVLCTTPTLRYVYAIMVCG